VAQKKTNGNGKAVVPFKDVLAKQQKLILETIPKHVNGDRLLRVAFQLVQRTPKLMECDATSVVACIAQASALGLELGREAHLVPFGKVCTMIPDYKGLDSLARRSKEIRCIDTDCVYKGDEFREVRGTQPHLDHVPDLSNDRTDNGQIEHVYAVAYDPELRPIKFARMTKAQIDQVRAKSKAKDGPWSDPQAYPEMAKKTVVKRLCKLLPQTPELAEAIELDNRFESGEWSGVTRFDEDEQQRLLMRAQTANRQEELRQKLDAAAEAEAEPVEEEEKPKAKKKAGPKAANEASNEPQPEKKQNLSEEELERQAIQAEDEDEQARQEDLALAGQ